MKNYEITLNLVTPCISAGAEQSDVEFRAPSVRGALRHWFRVCGGSRDDEEEVFGGINAKTASRIVVRVQDDGIKQENCENLSFPYFLGVWGSKAKDRSYMPAGQSVKIQIIDKLGYPTLSEKFKRALFLWLYLGAIGSRSRRCFGSIYPEEIKIDGVAESFPKTLEEFKKYLQQDSGLKNTVILSLGKQNSAVAAMRRAEDYLKKFRCGSTKFGGSPSKWGKAEHDWISNQSKDSSAYRAVLGLPLSQRYSSSKKTFEQQVKGSKRWASPVYLKVVQFDGVFVPIVIFMKDYFLQEGGKLEWCENTHKHVSSKTISHELINAMMDLAQVKRLGFGNAEVLFDS